MFGRLGRLVVHNPWKVIGLRDATDHDMKVIFPVAGALIVVILALLLRSLVAPWYLMVARLREEAQEGHEPREAAALAVEHAGPSIGAAGVILAGTFGSLMFAGIAMMTQMGFAVSIGICIAACVMSRFLVPSVTALVGHAAWWPGHADRDRTRGGSPDPDPDERERVSV